MVTVHRLDQGKNSNFQALLEVSHWQEMSLFMDDLCTSNFPVFNASRSLTGFKIVAGFRRFFTQEIEKNAIPSLDRQNQRPWNVIVNVSYQKVIQP